MVPSKYNFFVERNNGQYLAYNARTSAMVLIKKEELQSYQKFSEGKIKEHELPNYEDWIRGGFIIDSNKMELDMIKFGLNHARFDTRRLSLTIAPTLSCNFACKYCYEQNIEISKMMNDEVQNSIVSLLETNIRTINNFSVTWYGGEPLIAFDVIKTLSKRFIEICEKNSVEYSAFIVTNGYLLSKEIAEELKNIKVTSAQITLDGPEDVHDQRRPLLNGGSTFNKILENVVNCADIIDIVLRVNIDKTNFQKNNQLLEILEKRGLNNKVLIYLGWVEPSNECYQADKCLSISDFSIERMRFSKMLKELGFKFDPMSDYPRRRHNTCGADYINSEVVSPNGDLCKCWSDIGIQEYRTGSIIDPNIRGNHERYYNYMLYDPTQDSECGVCKFLPICMGGCPKQRVDKNVERCTHVKLNLKHYLENAANVILEERESTKSQQQGNNE